MSKRLLLSLAGVTIISLTWSCTHTATVDTNTKRGIDIKFDHSYRSTRDAQVYRNLLERGFKSAGDAVNHPGRQTCEFIHLFKVRNDRAYIEFCYTNPALPTDYGVEEPDLRDPWPGFAISPSSGPLKSYFDENAKILQQFKAEYSHKNYDWAKDRTSKLPGWNTINFQLGSDPFSGIYTWILEYESRGPESEFNPVDLEKNDLQRLELRKHPNTARYILGAIWSEEIPKGQINLEILSDGKTIDGKTYLRDGTWVHWTKKNSELGSLFRDKTYPYLAVVLGVDSLETFRKVAKPDMNFKFAGRDAALIKLESEGWDIVAIEVP